MKLKGIIYIILLTAITFLVTISCDPCSGVCENGNCSNGTCLCIEGMKKIIIIALL